MIKHYVEYDFPGFFFPESRSEEVADRKPETIEKIIKDRPKNCFALRFYSQEESEGTTSKLIGEAFDYSKRYLFGTSYNKKQIEHMEVATGRDLKVLLSNMKINGYKRVILCEPGNWQELTEEDILVEI